MVDNVLNGKPKITLNKKNLKDVELLDLTVLTFVKNNFSFFENLSLTDEYIGRPDKVSYTLFGVVEYVDAILKISEISNPFSLNVGDVIRVPDLKSINSSVQNNNIQSMSDEIRKQYIDVKKKPIKDFKLNKLREEIEKAALPPNVSEFGSKQIEIRNGEFVFGENVTENKQNEIDIKKKNLFFSTIKPK